MFVGTPEPRSRLPNGHALERIKRTMAGRLHWSSSVALQHILFTGLLLQVKSCFTSLSPSFTPVYYPVYYSDSASPAAPRFRPAHVVFPPALPSECRLRLRPRLTRAPAARADRLAL